MGFVANYLTNLLNLCIDREPVRPPLFSYYITHRCELNCRYCCDGDGKRFKARIGYSRRQAAPVDPAARGRYGST